MKVASELSFLINDTKFHVNQDVNPAGTGTTSLPTSLNFKTLLIDLLRFDLEWLNDIMAWSNRVRLRCRSLGPLATFTDPASDRPLPLPGLGLALEHVLGVLEKELAPGIHAVLVVVHEGGHVVLQL